MKIYTVELGVFFYEGIDVLKVFLNKERAEEYLSQNKNNYHMYDWIAVEEYDVEDYEEELK